METTINPDLGTGVALLFTKSGAQPDLDGNFSVLESFAVWEADTEETAKNLSIRRSRGGIRLIPGDIQVSSGRQITVRYDSERRGYIILDS